jgi:hypothetical protein
MLHVITDSLDPLTRVVRDDPVRPEIPLDFRVSESANIFVLVDDQGQPTAAVCARYCARVPRTVDELIDMDTGYIAVFYTIWSYRTGAGRELILAARNWLEAHRPEIMAFVTLSPSTDMARRFHLRNGAHILSINSDTVNYCYI